MPLVRTATGGLTAWRVVEYIAIVQVSPRVASKIAARHNVSADEVREAVILTPVLGARWHIDERGSRLLVAGTTASGKVLKVVLYPVDANEGIWRLGTAFEASS